MAKGGSVVNRLIAYAFTAGVVIALVLGLVGAYISAWVPLLTSLLVLAGIVVGFFNIHPNETRDYVLFVTALVIVTSLSKGSLGTIQYVGPLLESVLSSILAFIVPSVVIVSVKAVIGLAKN